MTGEQRHRDAEFAVEGHTLDALLGGRVRLWQPADGYRAAIDPVLLAAAIPARNGERVLDLGCGVGAAAHCLLARLPGVHVTGLEVQARMAKVARDNAILNGWADRLHVLEGDVLDPPAELARESFDRVMLNPPYAPANQGRPASNAAKATATRESEATLRDWLSAGLSFLKARGGLTLIHRADRLDEILVALRGKAGALRVFPLWPAAGRPAKRVLVAARKAVAGPMVFAPGLVLHDADGGYTPEAEAVLRDAAGLDL
jgi:tRNA1(Val) A37 N6-methylase TrmN6